MRKWPGQTSCTDTFAIDNRHRIELDAETHRFKKVVHEDNFTHVTLAEGPGHAMDRYGIDRPTFDTGRTFLEVYLIDFEGDLYGRRLVVELWRRLRDERAFGNESELVAQIARDVDETRAAQRPV
mgnify:CR=1 FL=1